MKKYYTLILIAIVILLTMFSSCTTDTFDEELPHSSIQHLKTGDENPDPTEDEHGKDDKDKNKD